VYNASALFTAGREFAALKWPFSTQRMDGWMDGWIDGWMDGVPTGLRSAWQSARVR